MGACLSAVLARLQTRAQGKRLCGEDPPRFLFAFLSSPLLYASAPTRFPRPLRTPPGGSTPHPPSPIAMSPTCRQHEHHENDKYTYARHTRSLGRSHTQHAHSTHSPRRPTRRVDSQTALRNIVDDLKRDGWGRHTILSPGLAWWILIPLGIWMNAVSAFAFLCPAFLAPVQQFCECA